MCAFTQLAAQLGYLRLSGYRLDARAPRAAQQRRRAQPGHRRHRGHDPRQASRRPAGFGGGNSAARLLAGVRSLPPAGAPPDLQDPELLRQVLLALALRDENVSGAEAAELADRALELTRGNAALDPPAALEAAKNL